MAKPKGERGSWFASWKGERLPCVHDYWSAGIWPWYSDPNVTNDPKWPPFIEAIRHGQKVILTNDKLDNAGNPSGNRDSYIALYRIDSVGVEDGKLRFRFVERLENFK